MSWFESKLMQKDGHVCSWFVVLKLHNYMCCLCIYVFRVIFFKNIYMYISPLVYENTYDV